MSFDYVERIKNVINVLNNNNTITANGLSASITTKVQNIINDQPNIQGLRIDRSPALFVSVNSSSEEETSMGDFTTRRKQKDVIYDIHGIYKKEGFSETHESHMTDFYQLANNLENVLKRNATLSNTALHITNVDTDFKSEQPDNTYVKVFKTTFIVRYFYT